MQIPKWRRAQTLIANCRRPIAVPHMANRVSADLGLLPITLLVIVDPEPFSLKYGKLRISGKLRRDHQGAGAGATPDPPEQPLAIMI